MDSAETVLIKRVFLMRKNRIGTDGIQAVEAENTALIRALLEIGSRLAAVERKLDMILEKGGRSPRPTPQAKPKQLRVPQRL